MSDDLPVAEAGKGMKLRFGKSAFQFLHSLFHVGLLRPVPDGDLCCGIWFIAVDLLIETQALPGTVSQSLQRNVGRNSRELPQKLLVIRPGIELEKQRQFFCPWIFSSSRY